MGWVTGWRVMPWAERRWVPEALLCLLLARAVVAWLPFARLRRYLADRSVMGSPTAAQEEQAGAIGRVVRAVARHLPGEFACLTQALAARAMLARRGCPCALVIGVAPGEKLSSHAWLEVGARVITGQRERLQFTEMLRF